MLSSSVAAVSGCPEHTSASKLLPPPLSLAAQNFTVVNDGAEFNSNLCRRIAFQ